MTRTMTTHLNRVYYVFLNHMGYGIPAHETAMLNHCLTSGQTSYDFPGKFGNFTMTRTLENGLHGFRFTSEDTNPKMVKALENANEELAALDTEYPEWVWAEKPFWATA